MQCFIARHEKRDYPDIDFNLFLRYLMWGLWPFLISMIGGAAIMVLLFPSAFLMLIIPAAQIEGVAAASIILLAVGLGVIVMTAVSLLLIPMIIRASLMQDFAPAFSLAFIREFFAKVGVEAVLATLFLLFTYFLASVGGTLCFFIGVYPATIIWVFACWHFYQQLYAKYLERGGAPVTIHPDLHPPTPVPPPAAGS